MVKVQAFGVNIGIEVAQSNQAELLLDRLSGVLPVKNYRVLGKTDRIDHHFRITTGKKNKFALYKSEEKIIGDSDEELMLDRLDSQIRITVAEFAVENVFVHSGVVAWKGKAIMIPASSYKGKTTLVAELVKNGAVYYSDEYAVLDKNGNVNPFPKTLSIREKDSGGRQVEYAVEEFGGTAGTGAIPVGLVLVTGYKKYTRWKPEILSRGQGVLEIISHTVPIRNDPAFSLSVLNKVVDSSVVVKSERGEVGAFAKRLITYFEENVLGL